MTSKTELKELIELLRDEIRELKMEVEVLKKLIGNNNYVYPFVSTPIDTNRTTGVDYIDPNATGVRPRYPSITISDSSKIPTKLTCTCTTSGTILTTK